MTINPNDSYQYLHKGDLRDVSCINQFRTLLKRMNIMYSLRTELKFPQHGTNGYISRIHFHGFVVFKDYLSIYNFFLLDYCTLTKIASVQFNYARREHWLQYMLKQQEFIPPSLFIIESITLLDITSIYEEAKDEDI